MFSFAEVKLNFDVQKDWRLLLHTPCQWLDTVVAAASAFVTVTTASAGVTFAMAFAGQTRSFFSC